MVSFLYDSRGPEQDLEGAGLGFVLHSIFFFFNFTRRVEGVPASHVGHLPVGAGAGEGHWDSEFGV